MKRRSLWFLAIVLCLALLNPTPTQATCTYLGFYKCEIYACGGCPQDAELWDCGTYVDWVTWACCTCT